MNFGRVFSQSWSLTWRHKFLWIFGFFAGLTGLNRSFLRLVAGPRFTRSFFEDYQQWVSDPDLLLAQVEGAFDQIVTWYVGGAVVLFLWLTAVWLIMTMAEGAIIGTAVSAQSNEPISFRRAFRQGVGLLGRFIAVDTIVYFPLFIVLLVMMLLAFAALVGTAVQAFEPGASTTSMMAPLAIGLLCIIPFFCLLIPVGILSSAFRDLAFRDTAVLGTGIRQIVRHTWAVIKQNFGSVLILGVLLWGLQYAISLALSLFTIPIYAFATSPGLLELAGDSSAITVSSVVFQLISVGLESFIIFMQTIVHTFTAVVWTLAYKEMVSNQPD